ncbi:neutral/alkaline non-lysosomal ceramidase N-terminal domain-containing protein [Pleomorphovibrio marinus]|uniref:neutral/alkaline non-lysosomal ceramidase N-terminal domain-containing protein n=1 Tax=Pleomorphovibrio marinus TaxID=2164132 RepID=UPI000E0A4DCB|nr:neutral/alkaline non-lysosomal ceramidase N-terminal domain-containing protein [Pleomorphovibrio marinus]
MNTSDNSLYAGAALVDTTPPLGTVINGDFVPHYATKIHDPLFAKALVLQNKDTSLVFVVVDICVMGQELLDKTKKRISQSLGIPASHILISSTHTHAAGAVEEVHFVQADLAYRSQLPGRICEAVEAAHKSLQPAEIAFGKVSAPEHVRCRRYHMAEDYESLNPVTGKPDQVKTNPFGVEDKVKGSVSTPDRELSFMAVRGKDGHWISVLANYGLHYVGDWENGTISADYFGYFCRALMKRLEADEHFVGILSNGTSGDVNIWDFIQPGTYPKEHFAKSEFIGEDLASRLVNAVPYLVWEDQPRLAALQEDLSLRRRMPTEMELEHARRIIAKGGLENLVPNAEGWIKLYAREQLLLAEYPAELALPIQCFQVGVGRIGALPGEIFASTGLKLKKSIDGPYFTIGLANGNVGYIPPAKELEMGGYETWRCRISNLSKEAEEDIVNCLVRVAEGVFGDEG